MNPGDLLPVRLLALWISLSAQPLLWLVLTIAAFVGADMVFRRSRSFPLCNPVLLSASVLIALLLATGTPYARYAEGTKVLSFLLGPATVALAIPLYRQIQIIRKSAVALSVALVVGSLTAILTALLFGALLGGDGRLLLSLAPKSATAPIAMGISEQIGGIPSLTAALVIVTGIVGAALGPATLKLARIRDPLAQGLAIGVAAHGIGTARMMQIDALAGAIAGLSIGLNGLATALLVPLLTGGGH